MSRGAVESQPEARLEPSSLGSYRAATFGSTWGAEEAPSARGASGSHVPPVHVREVMTRNVVSIARTANLKHAVEAMTKHCITGLPVVDDGNRPVGVLSEKDVVRTLRELVGLSYPRSLWDLILAPEGRGEAKDLHARLLRTLETTRVQQAMSSPAFTIVPGATILVALSSMLERGVHRLVVVEDGKISGIITRRDILSGMVPG